MSSYSSWSEQLCSRPALLPNSSLLITSRISADNPDRTSASGTYCDLFELIGVFVANDLTKLDEIS